MRLFKVCKVLMLAILLIACTQESSAPIISQDELLSRINSASAPMVIDVRSSSEFDNGHVPGAIHVDFDQYKKQFSALTLKKDQEIVLYCEAGTRAKILGEHLQQQGYFEVRYLAGDMKAWRGAKLPVE